MKVRKLLERPTAFVVFVMLFAGSIFAGCGGDDKENIAGADRSGYEELDFHAITRPEGMDSFVLRPDGTVLGGGSAGKLYAYAKDGTGQQEVAESDSRQAFFCVDGERVYAYDGGKGAVVELTGKPGEGNTFLEDARVVTDAVSFHTIRNMVALDDKIYVLAIPLTEENTEAFYAFGSGKFEDYGEQVYCIDADSGEVRELGLGHIAAEYRSEDGRLFFYGWMEESYYLYEYDTEKERVSEKLTFDSMGNLLNVVVEGGYLFGISPSEGLVAVDLENGEEVAAIKDVYAMYGNDLQFYRGNLYVNNQIGQQIQRVLTVGTDGTVVEMAEKTSGDAGKETGDKADSDTESGKRQKRKETIRISASGGKYNTPLRTDAVRSASGMKTKVVEPSLDPEAVNTELMAGNPDVDIYVFSYGSVLTQRIRELGMYVPLNESKTVTDYLGKCFGYIQRAATNDNGDIWMVPLYGSAETTWYIQENMDALGVKPEELTMFDDYMAVLGRLQDRKGDYWYYNNAATFLYECDSIYDYNYNNYETGEVNFNTELYRHIVETLWPGWDRYGSAEANHPLFYKVLQRGGVMTLGETPDFDRSSVIFKTTRTSEHFPYNVGMGTDKFRALLEGWRVLPFPKLQSASEKNLVALSYAYVNPYSKQKEAATEYLEVVLEGQEKCISMPLFFREDMEFYEPYYDTSAPAFQDLYGIFRDADVTLGYAWDLSTEYITDYQRGLISFDEAIDRRQKCAETGLYE